MNTEKLTDDSIIDFGEHKGQKMANVPAHYLLWMFDQPWCRNDIKVYVTENRDVLTAERAINDNKTFDHKRYFGK